MKTKLLMVLAGVALLWQTPQDVMAAGACISARFHDWQNMGCSTLNASAGTPSKGGCPGCNAGGMPRWWVSEPYISLSVADTPMSYRMASGEEINYTFYYQQRSSMPAADEMVAVPGITNYSGFANSFGANCGTNASWSHNWLMSVIVWDPTWENSWGGGVGTSPHTPPGYQVYSRGYQALVQQPQGGLTYYNVQAGIWRAADPSSLVMLTNASSSCSYPVVAEYTSSGTINGSSADANGIYWGDTGIGVTLTYPDGSQDIFGITAQSVDDANRPYFSSTAGTSAARLLLTRRIDPQGRYTQLGYDIETNTFVPTFRLRYLVDQDERTTTFIYSSGFQLSEIDDPFGRKVRLTYTNLYYNMTVPASIVDAAGLTNSFNYQGQATNGWITSLTTPYGTTHFNYYEVPDLTVTNGFEQRAIWASEPEGAGQLYLYKHDCTGIIPASETSPTVPGQTNLDNGSTSGLSGHGSLVYRNSFHWGRKQYASLSTNYNFSTDIASSYNYQFSLPSYSQTQFSNALVALSTNDYNKAELKHWMMSGSDNFSITESLSTQRDPSPDAAGNIPGMRTWYNYMFKPSPELTYNYLIIPQITSVSRLLPDGSSQYTTYGYYMNSSVYPPCYWFAASNIVSYTKQDGTVGNLTNWYGYSGADLLSVSNSAGQYFHYAYNTAHQVTAITNSLNQATRFTYDSYNYLTQIQSPSGESITIYPNYYDSSTDTNGNFVPGPSFMLPQNIVFSPSGRSFTNVYYANLPASIIDDRGVAISNTWDGLNRLTSTIFPDGTTISNTYSRLDLVASKDRLNHSSYYAYDGLQHLTNYVNANGAPTTYSWCGCGSLTEIIDPQNGTLNPTYLNYDNQGNLTNLTLPDGSSLTYQIDLAGRVTKVSDGAGRYVQYAYNNQGLATNISSANGVVQSIKYDALNRVISATDANGVTVTNAYDLINELTSRTWSDQISEGFGYSTKGLIAYTNRDGKATYFNLDNGGRIIGVTNANHEITRLYYDSLNHITALWDANTNQTQWLYNEYGWLTNKVDGLGRNAFQYNYNVNGWLTNRWTPEKGNTAYTYDNVGNLKSIIYPQQTNSYAYDALNRLTNMVDGIGSDNFGYTPIGLLQGETNAWAGVNYTYVQGLRTAMNLSQPGGNWSQTYGYDGGWRMTNSVSPAGTFNYAFGGAASTLLKEIFLPNGANITNSYDSLGRLTGTAMNNFWGHTLDGYTYTPDPLGLRTNILRNLGMVSSTVKAGFDNIGQLTAWSAAETNGVQRLNEQLNFVYDPAHNLHSRTNNGLAQSFTTDAANELTGVGRTGNFTLSGATPAPATNVTVNGQTAQVYGDFTFARTNLTLASGNNTFTNVAQNTYGVTVSNQLTISLPSSVTLNYDNNGNLTNDGTRSFGFDTENQLTNITVAGNWRSDFIYDGLNRRRIERDYSWTGSTWTKTNEVRFIYDGYLLVQERDTNNNVLVTYTRGLDLSASLKGAGGIGGLLARTDTNGTTFYHADGNGNITALMDANQNIVGRYLYNPFGKLIGKWGVMADVNEMQFSSMPHHNLSGIYGYWGRFYDPNLQRWLNHDPIGERGGINLYGFVGNNPVNYVDPFGLLAVIIAGNNKMHPADPDRWNIIANDMATLYTDATGDDAIVVQANDLSDWQKALNNNDITDLTYVGHADEGGLNYSFGHSLTPDELAKLDFSHLSPNAKIHLYGCHSAGNPGDSSPTARPEKSIAQAFADKTGDPVLGVYGGLSFGYNLGFNVNYPALGDKQFYGVRLFPYIPRSPDGSFILLNPQK